jgi:transcriptional regulator with XRE-family HTH domain
VVRAATAAGFDPERLRELRVEVGLTQRELAERTGTDHTTIAKYETGDRIPFVERLAALAAALGVTPSHLTAMKDGTLAELRTLAGLSQQGLAQRAGLVRTRYSAIERGEVATLDPDIAARIARALNLTPAQVITAHSASRAAHERHRR